MKIPVLLVFTLTLLSRCNNSKEEAKKPGRDSTERTSDTPSHSPSTPSAAIDRYPDCNPTNDRGRLPAATIPQQAAFWCWAASGQMVMGSLRTNVKQCEEANDRFRRTQRDCCGQGRPDDCDDGGWPDFEKHGFLNDRTTASGLPWAILKKQIDCAKAPFCVTWRWDDGTGGHMMVISAYKLENGDSMVKIRDPLPVNIGSTRWVRYREYLQGPGYTHWDDLYNVRKNNGN